MKKTLLWLEANIEPILMTLLFFAMISLVALQVVLRVLGKGFNWGEEVSRLLFVWLSFISFGYLTRNCRHVRMSFARNALPDKLRRVIMIIVDVLFLIFVIFGFVAAVTICQQTAKFGDNLVTVKVSANILYATGLVGFLLMIFRCIQTIGWKLRFFNADFAKFENVNGEYYQRSQPFFVHLFKRDTEKTEEVK